MAFLDPSENWKLLFALSHPKYSLVLVWAKRELINNSVHFGTEVGQGHFLPFLAIQFHSLYSLIYLRVFYALLKKARFLMLQEHDDLGIIQFWIKYVEEYIRK